MDHPLYVFDTIFFLSNLLEINSIAMKFTLKIQSILILFLRFELTQRWEWLYLFI